MSEAQIQDLDRRLTALTQEVNSLKAQVAGVGTAQAAIAQIYTRLDTFAETTNNNFTQVTQRFDRIEGRLGQVEARLGQVEVRLGQVEGRLEQVEVTQETHTQLLNEIIRILRDRNGGTGI